MKTFPIGLQTRSLRVPIKRALVAAGELGAEGVVIDIRNEVQIAEFSDTSFRQFRKHLEDYRLRVAAIAYPTRRGLDEPQDLERRILALREAMTFGYKIGAQTLLYRMDKIPTIGDSEENLDPRAATLIQSLEILAAHGDRVGTRLAIASSDDPERQAALLDRLPEGLIGIDLDPAGLLSSGHDPEDAAAGLGQRILHVRANDAVRELATGASAKAIETPLGRGSVDLPALLARLEEHDYHDWISVERTEGDNPSADLANAISYLRAL